jgi:two-component system, NtrC family, response regulator AtoC
VAQSKTESVRLLVVSREPSVLRPFWSVADPNGWEVETASGAWDAIERVQSGAAPRLVFLDCPPGDGDNLHVLRWMRRLRPSLPVILICTAEDAARNHEAIRLGAQELLIRPFDEAHLESAIRQHLGAQDDGDAAVASEDIEQLGPDSFFFSASPITQKLRQQAELLAQADVPALILGETGTGKDTVARLIHKLSVRCGFQFLKVNCADMPADLLGAELFGTCLGGRNIPGKIQRADKGTIFLEEIAEMPLTLQSKLMQILQDKTVSAPGTDNCAAVDVRILASTSENVDRSLARRKLQEELYYRLSAFTVLVPPLRQRKSEIALLLRHSMHRLAKHYGLPPREFSSTVLSACHEHSWPGNVKELENFVKRYLVAGEAQLSLNDFKAEIAGHRNGKRGVGLSQSASLNGDNGEMGSSSSMSLKSLIDDVKCEAERTAISTALHKTGWNRKAAARLLQVSYRTLLYKIDQYHMSSTDTFLSPFEAGKFSLQGTRSGGKE